MNTNQGVPDAWDDDWVNPAGRTEPSAVPAAPEAKLTKAQRRAHHLEQQKQLWDSADNSDRFNWLEAQGVVPLRQEFKPQVTLLSRKPVPTVVQRNGGAGGAKLSGQDDEDSEEEARKKREADFEERQRKAKLEREEKQRRYAEARERIMGSASASTSASPSRENSQGRDNRRQKGRGNGNRRSQPDSPAPPSPARPSSGQLFDPDDAGRRLAPKREQSFPSREDQPLRQPRGPDNVGRGGFGFVNRGGISSPRLPGS